MKLLIIRHADPDYVRDSLTPVGKTEAQLLADYLKEVPITHAYVSPLGRAQETAQPTLAAKGMQATTLPWLREFEPKVRNKAARIVPTCAWDWYPEEWTSHDIFYTDRWYDQPAMQKAHVREAYEQTCEAFDGLLATHGYVRDGRIYRAERPNHDTLALFCHYGLGVVLVSHLIGVSPMVLWHGLCAAPSSITTVYTEERRRGVASFRVVEYGAVPHLARSGVAPSFSARFAECYDDKDRH